MCSCPSTAAVSLTYDGVAMDLHKGSLAQLDDVLQEWDRLSRACRNREYGDLSDTDGTHLITRARAAIRRIAGQTSAYAEQAEAIVNRGGYPGYVARNIIGVVASLRTDVAAGYLNGIAEVIHAALFGDFLEMAQHLLKEGYKDAAAVIAGSSLEAHLRQLCEKAKIATETTFNGETRPKKADLMNSELAKENIYSKLDQKNVTAWLDLRNKAAHGQYGSYQLGQVELLISGVRDFITRNPA
jgi:hypothetical protein